MHEKVVFQGEAGLLAGILCSPEAASGPNAGRVVVFVHGLWQHKNIAFLKVFGEQIPDDRDFGGLCTFRFDCRFVIRPRLALKRAAPC